MDSSTIKNLDEGLHLVGDNNRYQFILTSVLFSIGIMTNILYVGMPLMETMPIVNFIDNGLLLSSEVNYTLCNSNYNFTINTEQTKSTWVTDFNIYCDKFLISLLGATICFGGIVSTLIIQAIRGKGTKVTMMCSCLLMAGSIILLVSNNLVLFYLFLFLNGMTSLWAFILKINIMTEITNKHYRSYYNNTIYCSGGVALMVVYYLYYLNIPWKVIYVWNGVLLFIFTWGFYMVYVESPRFYFSNNQNEKSAEALMYIAKFNCMNRTVNFKERFHEYCVRMGIWNKVTNTGYDSDKDDEKMNLCQCNSVIDEKTADLIPDITKNSFDQRLFINFMISYPLSGFLLFFYLLAIKEYSYIMNDIVYIFTLFSIVSTFFISHFMNYLGRINSKRIIVATFIIFVIISHFVSYQKNYSLWIYLINRLLLSYLNMINHTHINESFPSTIRLKTFSLAFLVTKVIVFLVPFVYEYLKEFHIWIILAVSMMLMIAFSFQKETFGKNLEDN